MSCQSRSDARYWKDSCPLHLLLEGAPLHPSCWIPGLSELDQIPIARSGRMKGKRGIRSPSHDALSRLLPGQHLVTCAT